MSESPVISQFSEMVKSAIRSKQFVSMSASKPIAKQSIPSFKCIAIYKEEDVFFSLNYTKEDTQFSESIDTQHLESQLHEWFVEFRQIALQTEKEQVQLLISKKGKGKIFRHANPASISKHHNRQKKYRISPTSPFLQSLGLATSEGRIKDKSQKKYRQINRFLELLEPYLDVIANKSKLVDFGCGKGYLTFGLYQYFSLEKKKKFDIHGVDLKEEVIKNNTEIAHSLAFDTLTFAHGDIVDFDGSMDVIIALHACDTATDIAIAKGIRNEATLIVVAPCCQKQIRKQMRPTGPLKELLKNGIHMEQQAALVTDSMRALLMEQYGYKVKVMEFISSEHTAKNIMIIGQKIKRNSPVNRADDIAALKNLFGIQEHALEALLQGR